MSSKHSAQDLAAVAESDAGCACFNIRRASRAVSQLYDEALQPVGLRATQFSLLVGIALHGEGGIGVLAKGLVTDRTTITRNVQNLIDRGLVEPIPGDDRRSRPLRLTAKGRRLLKRAMPHWQKAQRQIREQLGEHGMQALKQLSDEVVNLVHPDLTPPPPTP